ncbi:hypothetical protein ElyMa_003162800 [Elysia marginata]|uniref:Uncharacterized protein n=1 Tax=Elysia marginata TaxID=1093978 RepID=A0AAV4J128_9GAST|nr:hypothetical protein ElyMa_003162800 [Elysia marginata]
MADIRFVKPPPDNRIRSFPHPIEQTHNTTNKCQINTGLDTTDTTLHITTPKRRKDHLPKWEIFITSRPKTETIVNTASSPMTVMDSDQNKSLPMTNQAQNKVFQIAVEYKQDFPQAAQSLQHVNSKIETSSNIRNALVSNLTDIHNNTSVDTQTSQVILGSDVRSLHAGETNSQKNSEIVCNTDRKTLITPLLEPSRVETTPFEAQAWVGEQKQIMDNGKGKTTLTNPHHAACGLQYVGLSDVSEEEVAFLPPVSDPTGCVSSTYDHLHDPGRHDCNGNNRKNLQNNKHSAHQTQDTTAAGKNSNPAFVSQTNDRKISLIGLPPRPYPIGPLRRSISEYDFNYENPNDDDGDEGVSFFSRIKHSKPKRPNLQEARADSLDNSTCQENQPAPKHIPKFAWTERPVMKTEIFGGSDIALYSRDFFSLKEDKESDAEFGQLSRTLTPVEYFEGLNSTHGGSNQERLYSARLNMRRFALADPERMIISQELREKLEKDVQKRKSSAVRKVSQFFNIQLGLNKEEDLI